MSASARVRGLSLDVVAYALSCALPLILALVIEADTLRVPFMDEWAWADLVYESHIGTLGFAQLWQQHNEHRLLFPNLIALALASLGGWSQLRETFFSLLLVVLTQIGAFFALRRATPRAYLPYVFLVVSLLLYSLAQMENWDWGFQIAWFLCNVCVVWALLLLGTAGQSWFALIAAMLLATVASYSSSQGLMSWPAGLAVLFLVSKRRPTQIGVWVLVACIVFAGYFHGYQKPAAHPELLIGFHHPLTYARYIGAYVGFVFGGWLAYGFAVLIGWVAIIVLAALIARVIFLYRSDRLVASRLSIWVGIGVYAVSVAAITGLGRVGFGETQALASRYASISIYVWIAVVALGAEAASRALVPRTRAELARNVALALVFAVLYVGSERAGLVLGSQRADVVRSTLPAMIVGSGPELTALYPSEPFVELELRQLKAVKDGPYYQ